jgi:DNA-binding MarR family transcriptional regulator
MTKDILEKAVADFLSIPPILNRMLRQKIIKPTFGDLFDKVITSIHGEIIMLLIEEGPLSIGEIGDMLMIAKAQMTQLIDKLVTLDIVERRAVKGDRRKIQIALTDKGMEFLQEHRKKIDICIMETMSHLEDKDLKALSESLAVVKDVLSRFK